MIQQIDGYTGRDKLGLLEKNAKRGSDAHTEDETAVCYPSVAGPVGKCI